MNFSVVPKIFSMKNIGLILVVVGILMLVVTGFNFVTRENIVDAGPIQINGNKNHLVQWSPIVGVVVLIAGAAMLVSKKTIKP